MRQRALLVRIVLLAAALLVLGAPAWATSSLKSPVPGDGQAQVDVPTPPPADDAAPSVPRFASAQRSPLAEATGGPAKTLHPTVSGFRVEPARVRPLEDVLGAGVGDMAPVPVYLLVCSFLN